jgi:isoleucyl-tRNA synthetase
VEYHDHSSPSVYVAFPLASDPAEIDPALAGRDVEVIIWTTTPWTLPANMAIAFHPDFDYIAFEQGDKVYIFAEGLAFAVQGACGFEGETDKILARFKGGKLEGLKARHPWINRDSIFVLADYVTLEAGTGCVHTAPGHGADDYFTGIAYGIPIYSPVDDAGCFTNDVEHWAGMNVFEANKHIVEFMRGHGCLLHDEMFQHSYPFGWRSKSPVIFRATEQWFFRIDHAGLRDRALEAIKETEWIPSWGEERMERMLSGRPDWCISRQRVWGVPIVAFDCEDCGGAILQAELVERAAGIFEQKGAASWFELPTEDFLPTGFKCPKCGGEKLRKETDTLDVWFDSGVSHAAVLGRRDDLPWPSDLYLEGQDQYRGWFQSSLLCGLAAKGGKPYRQVLTHGFVLDAEGRAMSKSLGNIIDMNDYMAKNGAEVLRLWVAMTDYRDDVRVSDEILKRNAEAYRKFRNTCRFLLGNIFDYDPDRDALMPDEMEEIDRYALELFERLQQRIVRAYERYEFHTVYHAINNFVTVDLSAFYLDILKDRLYCELPDDPKRRSAQTAFFIILDGLVRLAAPIISFTADEIWEHMPAWKGKEASVHMARFPAALELSEGDLTGRWESLRELREVVLKALEEARDAKVIGQSLEAHVLLTVPERLGELVKQCGAELEQLFIVSKVSVESGDELVARIEKAPGSKCERCWMWSPAVGDDKDHPTACPRCAGVLNGLEGGAS